MKIRIIKEVGSHNPSKYPAKNSFRGATDVKVTIVHPDGTEEQDYDNNREKLVFEEKAESSIQKWVHEDAQEYALELIERYGQPDVVTDKMVLWEEGISRFDKTYVLDESILP